MEFCPQCGIGLSNAEQTIGFCKNCHCYFSEEMGKEKENPFVSKINQFPIDIELKYEIACLITSYMAQLGVNITEKKQQEFQNKFSQELIESVLDAILKWEERKLN